MKKILLSILTLFIALCCNAQLLWKVSGNGLMKDSYIMGTHHVAPLSVLDSIKGLDNALKACDVVYGEIAQSEMNSAETQQKMMSEVMAPTDSTINKIYTAEQYDSIDTYVKKLTAGQMSLAQLSMFKPAMIGTQLTLIETMRVFPGFNPQQAIDMVVQAKGTELGKVTSGFETFDFQMDLLYGAPIVKQAEDLLKMMRLQDKSADYARELAKAYMSQDLNSLMALMADAEMGFDAESKEKMLDNRNEAWKNELIKLMPEKSVFVCVGAGHLPGKKGLLNLLRNLGYTVSPVK